MRSISDSILDIKGSAKDSKKLEKINFIDENTNDLENSQLAEEE